MRADREPITVIAYANFSTALSAETAIITYHPWSPRNSKCLTLSEKLLV